MTLTPTPLPPAPLPQAPMTPALGPPQERPAPRGGGTWARVRRATGVAVLAVLVWRLGTGPLLHGVRTTTVASLAAGVAITAVTTGCAAWRWTVVARGLGVRLPWWAAFAAYYRSQFLNTALPGGIVGDVHRGVAHGHDIGDVGLALRAVAWERAAGQAVQAALAVVVLAVLPSPVRSVLPAVAAVVAGVVAVAILASRICPSDGPSRWARAVRTAGRDVRVGLLDRRTWPAVLLASVVIVAGHTAAFLVAARTSGSSASMTTLLPLAVLVMLATSLPTNIGGWGPREGASAWLFGAAGLGADQGVSAATAYGVMVLVACLPGAVVLAAQGIRRRGPSVAVPLVKERVGG